MPSNHFFLGDQPNREGDSHEQVWSLCDPLDQSMSGSPNDHQQQQQQQQQQQHHYQHQPEEQQQSSYQEQGEVLQYSTQRSEQHHRDAQRPFRGAGEQPPPGLLVSGRSDTINSSTVFAPLSDVQPHSSSRYSGAVVSENDPEHNHLHKRRLSESDSTVTGREKKKQAATVILINPDGSVRSEESIFLEEPDEAHIPLGGAAENMDLDPSLSTVRQSWNNSNGPFSADENSNNSRIGVEENSNNSWISSIDDKEALEGWTTTVVPEHQLQLADSHQSPVGVNPSTVNYPGHHLFEVMFHQTSATTKNKHWDYSERLRKLFIDMNKWVQIDFRVGPQPPQGLYIRVLPIYAEASHLKEPVKRCPNHASPSDPTNSEFPHLWHLVRVDGKGEVMYCRDEESGRLSVVFPVLAPHQGSEMCNRLLKFMCLGSDVGGINRRAVKVIFTLELGGTVVGRKVVDVRICSCPKRDRQQEEARWEQQAQQARKIGQRFAETSLVVNKGSPCEGKMGPPAPPPGNKKTKVAREPIILVPVHADDFKKINEFAEAAWVMRDRANEKKIKETRRKLLQEHNSQLLKEIEKKKP